MTFKIGDWVTVTNGSAVGFHATIHSYRQPYNTRIYTLRFDSNGTIADDFYPQDITPMEHPPGSTVRVILPSHPHLGCTGTVVTASGTLRYVDIPVHPSDGQIRFHLDGLEQVTPPVPFDIGATVRITKGSYPVCTVVGIGGGTNDLRFLQTPDGDSITVLIEHLEELTPPPQPGKWYHPPALTGDAPCSTPNTPTARETPFGSL